MGWIESDRKSSKQLIQAVKSLRAHFGESQEAFGKRLGLSKRAITNYEIDRRPTAGVLARLALLSSEVRMSDTTFTFFSELAYDLDLHKIRGGHRSYRHGIRKGFIFVQYDDDETRPWIEAFFDVISGYQAGDPATKEKARQILETLAKSTDEA